MDDFRYNTDTPLVIAGIVVLFLGLIAAIQLCAALYCTIKGQLQRRKRDWLTIYWFIHMPALAYCLVTGQPKQVLIGYLILSPFLLIYVFYHIHREKRVKKTIAAFPDEE